MSNPFSDYKLEDVERHNAQVAAKANSGFRNSSRLDDFENEQNLSGPATNRVHVAIKPSTDEAKLNKLERAWLTVMRQRNYSEIGVQSITLKIGDDCRFTCDFSAIVDGVFTFFETKGFMRGDAQVKLKVAARQFRWARFILVEKIKGQWQETEIKP